MNTVSKEENKGLRCSYASPVTLRPLRIQLQFLWSKIEKEQISTKIFSQFFAIKTLDPYPDPDSLEMLDPDPYPDHNTVENTNLLSFFFKCSYAKFYVNIKDDFKYLFCKCDILGLRIRFRTFWKDLIWICI